MVRVRVRVSVRFRVRTRLRLRLRLRFRIRVRVRVKEDVSARVRPFVKLLWGEGWARRASQKRLQLCPCP